MLAAILIAGAVLVARPGETARDRLPGRRARIDVTGMRRRARLLLDGPGSRPVLVASVLAGAPAGLYGGPVAGSVAAVYAGLAAYEWRRRAGRKRSAGQRDAHLDDLASLVADLRAGIPPAALTVSLSGAGRLGDLTEAVWRLAERTGAPAADLLERIESDARTADRSVRTAHAQAAGTQTTAIMLAALPLAGIALGHAIGADPTGVLLHSPLGAACVAGAVLLQCAGLKWAQRITEGVLR
ncbi:type II secretion system F family protein [Actinoplanes subglobosus]|uniref:Type II secretion system F family protein n=1 Tax=Actinoplanes subglobosus TaxID=1547892 RepID=A0ABV8IPU2_9ACTN